MDVPNSNMIAKTVFGYPTGCSASTTPADALLHPEPYPTKVVASTKMLPNRWEAASGLRNQRDGETGTPYLRPG